MAIESVATPSARAIAPAVEVPAQDLLRNYSAAIDLSIKLEGVVGIMAILTDRMSDNTHENNALNAVQRMLEECLDMSELLQWPIGTDRRALDAIAGEAS